VNGIVAQRLRAFQNTLCTVRDGGRPRAVWRFLEIAVSEGAWVAAGSGAIIAVIGDNSCITIGVSFCVFVFAIVLAIEEERRVLWLS
jgi:hypothetical protein